MSKREDKLIEALRMIELAYRLAPRSTPANLRRAIVDARPLLDAAFARHQAADPHCTCNDCLEDFDRRTDNGHWHSCKGCGAGWRCTDDEDKCNETCPTCGESDQADG